MGQDRHKQGAALGPPIEIPDTPPLEMLNRPITYLLAEHLRHRCICALLRQVATGRCVSQDKAEKIVGFFEHDLVTHHLDEEEDLFPAIAARAHKDDMLGSLLLRLVDEHRHMQTSIGRIIAHLSRAHGASSRTISHGIAHVMQGYASHENRHLAIENGIVLAIARKRLKPVDLEAISRSMRARREARL